MAAGAATYVTKQNRQEANKEFYRVASLLYMYVGSVCKTLSITVYVTC